MGNCGVGFAPVAPDRHEWLIGLMEGVEDIPGAALSAGIQWGWESFPEFLDALDARVARDGPRHAGAPRRRARLRDGRARGAQRAGHVRRHRGDGRHRPRRASRPAPSASRPAARSPTAPSTASRCPAPSRPRTSCSASAACSASSAPACSSWRRPARSARTWPRPSGRWTGCAACPRPSAGRSPSPSRQNNSDPTSWKRLLDLSAAAAADGVRGAPAGARPHRLAAARLPDLPPARLHRRRGATPASGCSRGRSRWPASTPTPTSRARIVADAPASAATRS